MNRRAAFTVDLAACAAGLLLSCSGARSVPEMGDVDACALPPNLEVPAPALAPLQSHLAVHVTSSKAALERVLASNVPVVLAKASGRSMGAPGKVTYEVRRRGFSFDVTKDALLIRTQLEADIQVCKPLGPVCLHYGACRPEWGVLVSVPRLLSFEHAPRPTLELAITNGCVLRPVGYDATSELSRITQSEARKVRGEIQRQVDRAHQHMQDAWHSSAGHVRFGDVDDDCVGFALDSVQQTPIDESDDALNVALRLDGRLELGCERRTRGSALNSFPETKAAGTLAPRSELLVATEVQLSLVSRTLSERLRSDGVEAGAVQLSSGVRDGRSRLYAGVQGFSRCATEWFELSPQLEGGSLRLLPLGETLATAPLPSGAPPLDDARRWLAARGDLVLPDNAARLQSAFPEALERGLARANESDGALSVDARWQPVARVETGAEELRAVFGVEGTVRIAVSGAEPHR